MKLKELENMIEDHIKLYEQAGTFGADINEIMTGFYLGNGKWSIYGDSAPELKKLLRREENKSTQKVLKIKMVAPKRKQQQQSIGLVQTDMTDQLVKFIGLLVLEIYRAL
jgi:hypothetical protein